MSRERLNKLISVILETSKTLDESIPKIEDKMVDGVGRDLKKTIEVLKTLEKFNRIRMEDIMTIKKASRARQFLEVINKGDLDKWGELRTTIYYRVEGKVGDRWELIMRTSNLHIADIAKEEHADKYDDIRIMQETPKEIKPVKGR